MLLADVNLLVDYYEAWGARNILSLSVLICNHYILNLEIQWLCLEKTKQLPFVLEGEKTITLVPVVPCLAKFGHRTATSCEVIDVNQSVDF